MKDYPLERGYEEFLEFVENILSEKKIAPTGKLKPTYSREPIPASREVETAAENLPVAATANSEPTTKELLRKGAKMVVKRARDYAGRKARGLYHRIKNIR